MKSESLVELLTPEMSYRLRRLFDFVGRADVHLSLKMKCSRARAWYYLRKEKENED